MIIREREVEGRVLAGRDLCVRLSKAGAAIWAVQPGSRDGGNGRDGRVMGAGLVGGAGLELEVAQGAGSRGGGLEQFLWNNLWTFRVLGAASNDWPAPPGRLGRFNLIWVARIVWSVLLLNLHARALLLWRFLNSRWAG
jgi:hypothetical protein